MLNSLCFGVVLFLGVLGLIYHARRLKRTISQGCSSKTPLTNRSKRWKNVLRIALGQSKMGVRVIPAVLHLMVYLGFFIINIEIFEIILDGLLGTHRIFAPMGHTYRLLIGLFEIFAVLVIIAVIGFWLRRNILRLLRFWKPEMSSWSKTDANIILYFELVLMSLFLLMNATDTALQIRGITPYTNTGAFAVSGFFVGFLEGCSVPGLIFLERVSWWMHIVGVLGFANYIFYSKHLHIVLAFPNTFFASITPKGDSGTLPSITGEIKMMLGFISEEDQIPPQDRFGVADIGDLSRIQLLSAFTCTECGRCTDDCPANKTGKKLSPRKIMMDIRHRSERLAKGLDSGKKLIGDYISEAELWACTTCNACVESCPINIDPLSIIMDMRRYLTMEQSLAPSSINTMMANIENNGAPWLYGAADRLAWLD